MADIRKIIIIFVVAILFSVLVFSLIESVYSSPKYEDFCKEERYPIAKPITRNIQECSDVDITDAEIEACRQNNGDIMYDYDANGCAVSFECSTCRHDYDQSREKYNQYVFYISAVLALVAIFVGLYLPAEGNTLNEWIGTGFMLGGAFALFFGTARSFSDLDRIIRPIIIFLELVLVIFIAYRKVGNLRKDKKSK